MSILVSIMLFYTVTGHLLWYLPGDVLAAPASALCGWKGVNSLSLSLSLSLSRIYRAVVCSTHTVETLTVSMTV